MKELIFVTHNAHKALEVKDIIKTNTEKRKTNL